MEAENYREDGRMTLGEWVPGDDSSGTPGRVPRCKADMPQEFINMIGELLLFFHELSNYITPQIQIQALESCQPLSYISLHQPPDPPSTPFRHNGQRRI